MLASGTKNRRCAVKRDVPFGFVMALTLTLQLEYLVHPDFNGLKAASYQTRPRRFDSFCLKGNGFRATFCPRVQCGFVMRSCDFNAVPCDSGLHTASPGSEPFGRTNVVNSQHRSERRGEDHLRRANGFDTAFSLRCKMVEIHELQTLDVSF